METMMIMPMVSVPADVFENLTTGLRAIFYSHDIYKNPDVFEILGEKYRDLLRQLYHVETKEYREWHATMLYKKDEPYYKWLNVSLGEFINDHHVGHDLRMKAYCTNSEEYYLASDSHVTDMIIKYDEPMEEYEKWLIIQKPSNQFLEKHAARNSCTEYLTPERYDSFLFKPNDEELQCKGPATFYKPYEAVKAVDTFKYLLTVSNDTGIVNSKPKRKKKGFTYVVSSGVDLVRFVMIDAEKYYASGYLKPSRDLETGKEIVPGSGDVLVLAHLQVSYEGKLSEHAVHLPEFISQYCAIHTVDGFGKKVVDQLATQNLKLATN